MCLPQYAIIRCTHNLQGKWNHYHGWLEVNSFLCVYNVFRTGGMSAVFGSEDQMVNIETWRAVHILRGHTGGLWCSPNYYCLFSSSSSSCGLSSGRCLFHEWPPCLPVLCSMIGSCQTNVKWSDIRFNCAEPSLARSASSVVPVPW